MQFARVPGNQSSRKASFFQDLRDSQCYGQTCLGEAHLGRSLFSALSALVLEMVTADAGDVRQEQHWPHSDTLANLLACFTPGNYLVPQVFPRRSWEHVPREVSPGSAIWPELSASQANTLPCDAILAGLEDDLRQVLIVVDWVRREAHPCFGPTRFLGHS